MQAWYINWVASERDKLNLENWTAKRQYTATAAQNGPRKTYWSVQTDQSEPCVLRDGGTPASIWAINYSIMESLILAQDERWRRA